MSIKICVIIVVVVVVVTCCSIVVVGGDEDVHLNKFTRYIFNKYGSGGVINFEGFEHLLHNIGLANIEFSVNHTIEEHRPRDYKFERWNEIDENGQLLRQGTVWHEIVFKQLHGNHHHETRHSLLSRTGVTGTKQCLSPMSIFKLSTQKSNQTRVIKKRDVAYNNNNNHEDEIENELRITTEMFKEICPALIVQIDGHDCEVDEELMSINYTMAHAWTYATASIFIISICGLFGLLMVPIAKTTYYNSLLGFLVAIAVGTLLGDALMHLLPHALVPHGHGGGHKEKHDDKEPIYLCLTALVATIFMYSLENLLPLIGGGHTHGHGHHEHEMEMTQSQDVKKRSDQLSPVAFMVVIGDGLHNITDGLAIGAAFVSDPITGFSTAIAVLCHELPHELGDFALLLRTGVSVRKACKLNIVSSVLSFFGMAAGLLVSTEDTAKWIYSATAGTFMYIALSDLIPEMQKDKDRSAKQIFIQIFGVLLGGVIMLFIGLYENDLRNLFE